MLVPLWKKFKIKIDRVKKKNNVAQSKYKRIINEKYTVGRSSNWETVMFGGPVFWTKNNLGVITLKRFNDKK